MLLQDIRHAARALARRPAFTLAAAMTLAIGIGATTAIYSTVRAVLWRPLPFAEPDALVMVSSTTVEAPNAVAPGSVSPPDFTDWQTQAASFSHLAALNIGGLALTGEGPATQVPGAMVTGEFFDVLGVRAALGRTLQASDDAIDGANVVVLSDGLWTTRFGVDRAVIGRSIMLDGLPREVVGVMPRGFQFPFVAELWVPLRFTANDLTTQRGAHYLSVIGRLAPGATLAAARAEMTVLSEQLAQEYSQTNKGGRASVHDLRSAMVGDVRPAMRLLLAAVGLVLLVACVNVANLVIGVQLARGRDVALRAALGADRSRLIRGQLVESLLLAGFGGGLGLALAAAGTRAISAFEGRTVPFIRETRLDLSVLVFAAGATVAAAILFGLLPAWQSSRSDVASALRDAGGRTTGDRSSRRTRGTLVAAEVALAVALLIGAGLVARSFTTLVRVDLGFDADRVQTASLSLPGPTYPIERRAAAVTELVERLGSHPDVEAAGAVFGLPLTGLNYYISGFDRDGERLSQTDAQRLTMQIRVVTPGYFRVMGIPIVAGRSFSEGDIRGRPAVAIVSESAARAIWPDARPVGRSFHIGTRMGLGGDRVGGEVVGVAGDVRDAGPAAEAPPTFYVVHAQVPVDTLSLVVKGRRDALSLVEPLRATVASIDPDLPVFRVRAMTALAAAAVAEPRLYLSLLGLFAIVAILLAAVGVYGVMAQNVSSRTREIGIRLALGADRSGVVWIVVRSVLALAGAGVLAGWSMAFVARESVARLLFGVGPADPLTYAAVGAVALLVAVSAAWLPARRAARVDPATTLRMD